MLNFTMRGTLKKPSNNLNKIQNMYRKKLSKYKQKPNRNIQS